MMKVSIYEIRNKYYGKSFLGKKIELLGFKTIPKEFSNQERGFPFGKTILELIESKFRNYSLQIIQNGKSTIRKRNKITVIRLGYDEYHSLISKRFPLKKDLDQRLIFNLFTGLFPKYFTGNRNLFVYTKGMFFSLLESLNIRQLSKEDIIAICRFSSEHSNLISDRSNIKRRVAEIRIPIIRQIVTEIETGINKDKKESFWQEMFRKNYLFINDEYVQIIEKQNLSISIKDHLPIEWVNNRPLG